MSLVRLMLRSSALLTAAALASAHLTLHVAPAGSVDMSAAASAAHLSGADQCASFLGTHPAWDPHAQQQRWYAARLSGSEHCASQLAHGGEVVTAPVGPDELYFWVSQVAIAEDGDACPWYARLAASLGERGAGAFGLDLSCGGPALVMQRRASGAPEAGALAALAAEGISEAPRIVSLTAAYAVLALPRTAAGDQASAHIDRFLPFDTHVARIALDPSRARARAGAAKPEPSFPRVEYDPVVARVLNDSELAVPRFEAVVKTLSGEDQTDALAQGFTGWNTRHSGTWGARHAADWIQDDVERSLVSLPGAACTLWRYNEYYAPNVVCTIPAASAAEHGGEHDEEPEYDGEVVVSAHYDSRGTFGELTAPGADDDGSGTAALIVLARTLGNYGVRFRRPVRLVFFSGEEQGLLGSAAYAAWLAETGTPVHLAFQLDMLAYRVPGEPRQIAFPDKLSTASVTAHVTAVAQTYVPELVPGFTPACCSDHQSFWDAGFPASWAFERNGPIRDPFYHNSGDLVDRPGYDLVQLQLITKVVLATILTRGEFFL